MSRDAASTIFDSLVPLLFASNDEDYDVSDASLLNRVVSFLLDCVCACKSDDSHAAIDATDDTLCADDDTICTTNATSF